MIENAEDNLRIVHSYITAIEANANSDTICNHLSTEIIQTEYPNKLNPKGGKSNLNGILSRLEQGKKMLTSQKYEIQNSLAYDSKVAIEAVWKGVLSVSISNFKAGDELMANIAMFFELKNGKIVSQTNYDCFWSS